MTSEPPSPRGKNIVTDIVPYAWVALDGGSCSRGNGGCGSGARVALEGGSCSRGKRKGGRDAAVVRRLHPGEARGVVVCSISAHQQGSEALG